jgi:hypothetical protein
MNKHTAKHTSQSLIKNQTGLVTSTGNSLQKVPYLEECSSRVARPESRTLLPRFANRQVLFQTKQHHQLTFHFTTLQPYTHPKSSIRIQTHLTMADANGSAIKEDVAPATTVAEGKGKGKAPAQPQSHDEGMDVDESSSEEEIDEVINPMDLQILV